MIFTRKLDGGEKKVPKFFEQSASTGVDLIELLMIPRNKGPYFSPFEIQGYEYPIDRIGGDMFDENGTVCDWVDGTLVFYPDEKGMCYGYVFDTEKNRDLIATSLSTGWYRIVDQSKRDEILKYAESKGYDIKPRAIKQVSIRKTKRERDYEDRQVSLEKQLFDTQEKLRKLELQKKEADRLKEKEVEKRVNRHIEELKDPNADDFTEEDVLTPNVESTEEESVKKDPVKYDKPKYDKPDHAKPSRRKLRGEDKSEETK